jgi:hypothetical protein
MAVDENQVCSAIDSEEDEFSINFFLFITSDVKQLCLTR